MSLGQAKQSCIISIFFMLLFTPLLFAENSNQSLPDPNWSQLFLTEKEQAWLSQHKIIRVGADPAYPPFDFFDDTGRYSGMGAAYLALLGKRLGVEFKIIPGLTWQEVVQGGKERTLDLIPVITNRPDRREFLNFTHPYLFFPTVIVTRKEAAPISGMEDLIGKTLAVSKGYSEVEYFKEKYPGIKQLAVENSLEELQAVALGKADAATGNIAVSGYLIQKNNLTNLTFAGSDGSESNELTMGIRNDWPELVTIINKALNSITRKEHNTILSTWGVSIDDLERNVGIKLTAEERLWLKEHPVLRVGADQNWAPMQFKDDQGSYTGISFDYLKRLEEILGVEFRVVPGLSVPELIHGILTKEFDLMPSVAKTAAREKLVLFTEPYISMGINIFARDDVSYLGNLDALAGKRVAVVDKYAIHESLAADHPDLELVPTENIHQGLEMLASGKVFAFVGNVVATSYYIGKKGLRQIRVAGETPYMNMQSMAVRDDWPILVDILQKALDALPKSEHAAIYNNWMSIKYEHRFDYTLLWQVLLVAALLLLAFVYWNRRLARAEAELKKANERLRELDQLKSMFISSMSHELRTPLNSIIGFTGILLQEIIGDVNEQQRDSLERVQRAGRHLLALISDVIDISKVEAGRVDVYEADFQLDELLQEAVDTIEPLAQSKDLSVTVQGDAGLTLHSDRKRLLQCVLNFLSNAVKYTEKGTVTVTVREFHGKVEIGIQDTGIGISTENQASLFQPFERLDSHMRVKAGGSGLGLYLTNKITTDLLQGHIFMKSRLGKGSTFGLRIPKVLNVHGSTIAASKGVGPDEHRIDH